MEHKILEREAEVKKLEYAYPQAVANVTRHYYGRKAHAVDEKLILESSVRAQDLATEFCKLAESKIAENEFYAAPGLRSHDEFEDSDSSHYGMRARKLAREYRGETNTLQGNLEKARAELEKTGLKEALQENMIGTKKKRRRYLNEHDGDWDLDRKWDANPFMSTLMSKVEFPYIEIIFPINMNSGAGGDTISRFNSRCLALAEVFENAGYRVAITAEGWQQGILRAEEDLRKVCKEAKASPRYAGEGMETLLTRFVVRESNEYGDIQSFACFSSVEFFRRTIFSCTYNTFHYVHGLERACRSAVSSSYGRALDERPIPPEQGQLVLTHDLIGKLFGTDHEIAAKIFNERVAHVVKRTA